MRLIFSNNQCAAFLAAIVRSFQQHYPNGFLGRTAMQKLAYFSKTTGVPIPCSFEIYNYGPYSDQVTFAVDSLLADEVLLDTSENSDRYSNYRLVTQSPNFPPAIEQRIDPYRAQIDRVVSSLGQLRPEQLELVATLHFIYHRQQGILRAEPEKERVFAEFFRTKGTKFNEKEVQSCYAALDRAGLLAPTPTRNVVGL